MTVKVEINDRLATVTIDRPEVRNALSRQVLADQRRRHRAALTVSRRW
jgi:enoyl-CoA hydratase/carnithine racemase